MVWGWSQQPFLCSRVWCVGSSGKGQEFPESEVPASLRSPDTSHTFNLLIFGALLVNTGLTASFWERAINTPKPPPLEAADSIGCYTRFLALRTLSNPLLVSVWSNLPNSFMDWEKFKIESKSPLEHLCILSIFRDSHLLLLGSSVLDG
jgi:hypothetical protein